MLFSVQHTNYIHAHTLRVSVFPYFVPNTDPLISPFSARNSDQQHPETTRGSRLRSQPNQHVTHPSDTHTNTHNHWQTHSPLPPPSFIRHYQTIWAASSLSLSLCPMRAAEHIAGLSLCQHTLSLHTHSLSHAHWSDREWRSKVNRVFSSAAPPSPLSVLLLSDGSVFISVSCVFYLHACVVWAHICPHCSSIWQHLMFECSK